MHRGIYSTNFVALRSAVSEEHRPNVHTNFFPYYYGFERNFLSNYRFHTKRHKHHLYGKREEWNLKRIITITIRVKCSTAYSRLKISKFSNYRKYEDEIRCIFLK